MKPKKTIRKYEQIVVEMESYIGLALSQTSFRPISTNSSMISMVLMVLESP